MNEDQMVKQKLNIAVLIDAKTIDSWIQETLKTISQSDHAQITYFIVCESIVSQLPSKPFFYSAFEKLEAKLYKTESNAQYQTRISGFDQAKLLNLEEFMSEETTNVDLILNFSKSPSPESILKKTTTGVWSIVFGNLNRGYTGPLGTWELFNGEHDTKVTVSVETEDAKEKVTIYETSFSNDKLFVKRHVNNILWNTSKILPRLVSDLHDVGSNLFMEKWTSKYQQANNQKLGAFRFPTNSKTIKAFIQLYYKAFKGVIERKFKFEQWILLYQFNATKNLDDFKSFHRILPPKDRIWADPFVIHRNSKNYVFLEEYLSNKSFGKISVMELAENGSYTTPKCILEKPYHLSYPFLIEDNGELFMIPESSQNNTIDLYKCIEFPYQWAFEKTLVKNIKALDTTIFRHKDKYYMFTYVEAYKDLELTGELFLFYANNLLSDKWMLHEQSPISTDRSKSRPAGAIYKIQDRIYRPAQNCTKHYGYAMKINEIATLDETTFNETEVCNIAPDWSKDMFSTHTINTAETLTVIDAKIKRQR